MKRRIFLIVSSIEKGGTQKIILDLFNYWKKKGHNVKIITFDKKIDLKIKKNLINLKLQNTSKNLFHAIFNNLKRIYKLRNIIKNNKYNHIVSFISTTNILAIISNIGLPYTFNIGFGHLFVKGFNSQSKRLILSESFSA